MREIEIIEVNGEEVIRIQDDEFIEYWTKAKTQEEMEIQNKILEEINVPR